MMQADAGGDNERTRTSKKRGTATPTTRTEAERIERWIDQAEKGELCVYTCLGLTVGYKPFSKEVMRMLPTLFALVTLQVLVPALLLLSEIRKFSSYPKVQTHEFRIAGFILYLYSLRNMYHGALDECRKIFLDLTFEYNLSWHYIWPLLLGEAINSFAAFILSVTLFCVFCGSLHASDLIINCIAINFIGSVDSEFTDDVMMKRALKIFREVMEGVAGQHDVEESCGRNIVEIITTWGLLALRVGGVCCLGCILAIVFATSHEEGLCEISPLLCMEALCFRFPIFCVEYVQS